MKLQPERLNHVADGVQVVPVRSPTLPPARHTNAWVLGDDDVVVVDPASPWPDPQQALADALADRRVQAIFLTHHHLDHVGGVLDLQRRTGAPVWAHPLTAARVAFAVDRMVEEGDQLQLGSSTWRALHTPGHATGHLCLHRAADGVVVAGDMVAGVGTIVLDPPEGELGAYLHHLGRLEALGPTTLLPAHGDPILDGPALLAEYIAHRHDRTAQVRAALARLAPARPLQLVPSIYVDLPAAFHPLAARQVLCHLRWLEAHGQARRTVDDGQDGAEVPWEPTAQPPPQEDA